MHLLMSPYYMSSFILHIFSEKYYVLIKLLNDMEASVFSTFISQMFEGSKTAIDAIKTSLNPLRRHLSRQNAVICVASCQCFSLLM